MRSLETSVTLGAITTAMSSCSRSQASRRISVEELKAPPARKTTSASASMATWAIEREEPSSGMPEWVVERSPGSGVSAPITL